MVMSPRATGRVGRVIHYTRAEGVWGYAAGDVLVDETGARSRVVADGRGVCLVPDGVEADAIRGVARGPLAYRVVGRVGYEDYDTLAGAVEALDGTRGVVQVIIITPDPTRVAEVRELASGYYDAALDGSTEAERRAWLGRLVGEVGR